MIQKQTAGPFRRESEAHRKRGAQRNETAVKHRKAIRNFSQSKDIHEDRGVRQSKLGPPKNPSRWGLR